MDSGTTSRVPSYDASTTAGTFHLFTTLATDILMELDNDNSSEVQGPTKKPPSPRVCRNYCDMTTEEVRRYMYVILVIILPTIAIFGVFGNISSMLVLSRQSLSKSSNILLLALAVGDLVFLVGCCQIHNIWRLFFKTRLTADQAHVMFYVHLVQNMFVELGNVMSVLLSLLITVERVIAVYLPLKFTVIVRPCRTRVAVVIVFLLGAFKAVIGAVQLRFQYNVRRGTPTIGLSQFYKDHEEIYYHIGELYNYAAGFFSIIAVCVGSILVGVRVSIAARMRAKMMSSSGGDGSKGDQTPRTSRTTVTLLAVCILFICTQGVAFCLEIGLTPLKTWLYYILRYQLSYLLYTVNSASNFIIYVALNKNFRDTYLSILMPWRSSPSGSAAKSPLVRTSTYKN